MEGDSVTKLHEDLSDAGVWGVRVCARLLAHWRRLHQGMRALTGQRFSTAARLCLARAQSMCCCTYSSHVAQGSGLHAAAWISGKPPATEGQVGGCGGVVRRAIRERRRAP